MLSRKNAPWPKNEKEAAELWRLQIKEAVLAEVLRREMLTKLAKEQGKAGSGQRRPQPEGENRAALQAFSQQCQGRG